MFYISSSNFPLFFNRIKAKIQTLATSGDENADTWDLQIIQYLNLNSKRLVDILQELSSACRRSLVSPLHIPRARRLTFSSPPQF